MRAFGSSVGEVFRDQPKLAGRVFVFPASRGEGPYQGAKRHITKLFALAEISGATSHTLRHTYASIASSLGYSDVTIGGLLGHSNRGITTRYIHRPDEAPRIAAQSVYEAIFTALYGGQPVENS